MNDLRRGGGHGSDEALNCSREGVLEGADRRLAAVAVRVYGEIRVEHRARSADGHLKRDPIACSGGELVIDLKIR